MPSCCGSWGSSPDRVTIESLIGDYGLAAIFLGADRGETMVLAGGLFVRARGDAVAARCGAGRGGGVVRRRPMLLRGGAAVPQPSLGAAGAGEARLRQGARHAGTPSDRLHLRLPLPLRPAHGQPDRDRDQPCADAHLPVAQRRGGGTVGDPVHRPRLRLRDRHRRTARPLSSARAAMAVGGTGGGGAGSGIRGLPLVAQEGE